MDKHENPGIKMCDVIKKIAVISGILFLYLSIVLTLCYVISLLAIMSMNWAGATVTQVMMSWIVIIVCICFGAIDMHLAFHGNWSPATLIMATLIVAYKFLKTAGKKAAEMPAIDMHAESDRVKNAIWNVAPMRKQGT